MTDDLRRSYQEVQMAIAYCDELGDLAGLEAARLELASLLKRCPQLAQPQLATSAG